MQIPGIDPEKLSNYERELAGLRLEGELLAMRLWLRGFHPDQLRLPAGNPDGGQWTIGGAGGDDARIESVQYQPPRRYTVDLEQEERRGGHAIRRHVHQSDEQMLDEVQTDRFEGLFFSASRKAHGNASVPCGRQ